MEQKIDSLQWNSHLLPQVLIAGMIYQIRNRQVMLDSDLAELYQIETAAISRAVKRNFKRFPEDFCFLLTKEECSCLKQRSSAANADTKVLRNRRTLPYVFTEQGIAMLSGLMRSEAAVSAGIEIMRVFAELRRFLSDYALLFEKVNTLEKRQLSFQSSTQEQLKQLSCSLAEQEPPRQSIFFAGQSYDAFRLLTSLIGMAESELILIDSYVDVNTLDFLIKKKEGVFVKIYTKPCSPLTKKDILEFNRQYPALQVIHTKAFHDRFLILDRRTAYHIGASVKDAGKRCFGITKIEDQSILSALLDSLAESIS